MNKKIDVIIISVTILDSPIIRDFIHKYYNLFNIYYFFTYNNVTYCDNHACVSETPYTEFIKSDLKGKCKFFTLEHHNNTSLISDWRDACIKQFLEHSNGDYILSLEPDMTLDWEKAIDLINKKSFKLMSFYRYRFWPSFWLCEKSVLNDLKYKTFTALGPGVKDKTNIDYNKKIIFTDNKFEVINANNQYYDHFDLVSTQIVDKIDNKDILLLDNENIWHEHYSGVTDDYCNLYNIESRYKKFYNRCINYTNVDLLNIWKDRSLRIINQK